MAQYRDRTFAKFDPTKPLVAQRQMTLLGVEVGGGDPIAEDVPTEVRRRLWMTHHATYAEDLRPTAEQEVHGPDLAWMDPADGVGVTAGDNGWYEVKADWAAEAEKVHGTEAAQARATELRTEGDDKGVKVEPGKGGWFVITAPGAEPLKIKGKAAAAAKAQELRDAITPAQPVSVEEAAALVVVTPDDDEFLVTAPWLEGSERFADSEAAEARQAALRAAGPPEGWTPAADDHTGE
jgi:hypothetical protein